MKLRAVNSLNHPAYRDLDRDSARCRVNMNTYRAHLSLGRIGSIVILKITKQKESKEMIVICSLWPDLQNGLLDDEICVTSTIQKSNSGQFSWSDADCEIIEIVATPKPCSSFRLDISLVSKERKSSIVGPSLSGLPISPGFTIQLSYLQSQPIHIKRSNPETCCVVSIHSICMFEEVSTNTTERLPQTLSVTSPSPANLSSTLPNERVLQGSSEKDRHSAFSRTSIVEEIIKRVIDPTIANIPCNSRQCGIMLLGPPGTGKTYAVKAVQHLCRDTCKVKIHYINIPELLSESNPCNFLTEKIRELEKEFKKTNSRQSKTNQVSMSPMKTFTPPRTPLLSPTPATLPPHQTPITSTPSLPEVHFIQIDEIDALGSLQHQNESQIAVKVLLADWMDRLIQYNNSDISSVTVCMIATSNRSEDIDRMFRRGGRLEYELYALNTAKDRASLLLTYLQKHQTSVQDSFSSLLNHLTKEEIMSVISMVSESTGGYVAADISALIQQLPKLYEEEEEKEKEELTINNSYQRVINLFDRARDIIQPSCLRGITVKLSKITFNDIIGYNEVKKDLYRAFQFYIPSSSTNNPRNSSFSSFLSQSLGGILLYGPPGNSKTRLVNACSNIFRLPLITFTSADIYSTYVGDAEAEIRKAFHIARQASPCILFFDEMDSLVTNRNQSSFSSNASSSSASVEARVLATFLNEMDGVTSHAASSGVIVMGATNRLDCIDPALIRKGRFYQVIEIPSPNEEERVLILDYYLKRYDVEGRCDREKLIGCLFNGMSGAEIENLCKNEIIRQM